MRISDSMAMAAAHRATPAIAPKRPPAEEMAAATASAAPAAAPDHGSDARSHKGGAARGPAGSLLSPTMTLDLATAAEGHGKSAQSPAHRARAALAGPDGAALAALPFGKLVSTLAKGDDLASLLAAAAEPVDEVAGDASGPGTGTAGTDAPASPASDDTAAAEPEPATPAPTDTAADTPEGDPATPTPGQTAAETPAPASDVLDPLAALENPGDTVPADPLPQPAA